MLLTLFTAPSRTPIVVTQRAPPQLTWEHEQDPNDGTSLSVWHKEYPYGRLQGDLHFSSKP